MGGKILEYEAKTILNQGRELGQEEGRKEGRKEGRNDTIYSLVQDGDLSPEKGAFRLLISVPTLRKNMEENGYKYPED